MQKKALARTDTSKFSKWWWSIDRLSLLLITLLVAMGTILVMASSHTTADRLKISAFYFTKMHITYLIAFFITIFFISNISRKNLKKYALYLYFIIICVLLAIFITEDSTKGAQRWLHVWKFSIQPSEFIKPILVVITAWMLTTTPKEDFSNQILAGFFYILLVPILFLQPDIGMLILITATFMMQLFIIGLPVIWFIIAGIIFIIGSIIAYCSFDHIYQRINCFLGFTQSNQYSERYQIIKSINSFINGGFWGIGPGEGRVKKHLPDSHTDFIFAVAAEEYGIMFCILLISLFICFLIKNLLFIKRQRDLFTILVMSGLIFTISLQAIINIASTLDLIPTKGMTLPFISFGGSALLSNAISCGIILNLSKHQTMDSI